MRGAQIERRGGSRHRIMVDGFNRRSQVERHPQQTGIRGLKSGANDSRRDESQVKNLAHCCSPPFSLFRETTDIDLRLRSTLKSKSMFVGKLWLTRMLCFERPQLGKAAQRWPHASKATVSVCGL